MYRLLSYLDSPPARICSSHQPFTFPPHLFPAFEIFPPRSRIPLLLWQCKLLYFLCLRFLLSKTVCFGSFPSSSWITKTQTRRDTPLSAPTPRKPALRRPSVQLNTLNSTSPALFTHEEKNTAMPTAHSPEVYTSQRSVLGGGVESKTPAPRIAARHTSSRRVSLLAHLSKHPLQRHTVT